MISISVHRISRKSSRMQLLIMMAWFMLTSVKSNLWIAMPFHPSNVYTIDELNANLMDILDDVEKKALVSLDNNKVKYTLKDKVHNGKLYVEQGVIAGCASGGFENICDAADILRGKYIGADEFSLSVYPSNQPVFMELVKNGRIADLMETGATIRSAFCGPLFWCRRRSSKTTVFFNQTFNKKLP